jgi:hypothetical protein
MTQEIKPAYTTFEQAKWLKKKGFDVLTWYCYLKDRTVQFSSGDENDVDLYNHNLWDNYSMPEQHQVVEWLRVNHGIHIEILLEENKPWNKFYYRIMKIGQYFSLSHDGIYSETPQEAYSAAFDYIKDNDLI